MPLPTDVANRLDDMVLREPFTMKRLNHTVQLRGLMYGEMTRIRAAEGHMKDILSLALAVEDIDTGRPIWSPDDALDHLEIAKLHPVDVQEAAEVINRLSGFDEAAGKAESKETGSGSTSLPVSSDAGLQNSSTPPAE